MLAALLCALLFIFVARALFHLAFFGRRRWGCHGHGHGRWGHRRFRHGPRGHDPGSCRHAPRGWWDRFDDEPWESEWDDIPPYAHGRGFAGPLAFIFERIEATPQQRRSVKEAVDELMQELKSHRGEMKRARGDVAQALRSEDFDVDILGDLLARQEEAVGELRRAAVGALGKIHAVLDPIQRERLARLLERGFARA